MYLSKLTLNPEPSARQVQRDLASPYELHRTIMRAFPDTTAGGPGRVLFRLEATASDEPPVVLVQSERKPDWSALSAGGDYLVSAESKEFDPSFRPGQRLRFRLRANPTVKRNGKRHGLLKYENQRQWLSRKAQPGGFRTVDFTTRRAGRVVSRADKPARSMVHLGVDYEGILEVTDPGRLKDLVAAGIGPAKGLGFGLLSLAPLRV